MLQGIYPNLTRAKEKISELHLTEQDFYISQDISMKYISTVVSVDGNVIYNNIKFWTTDVFRLGIVDNYAEHTVLDYLGNPVPLDRFNIELDNNLSRCGSIDGEPGKMDYDMEVGREMIDIVRTEFTVAKPANYSSLQFAQDVADMSSLIAIGCPLEAAQILENTPENPFLTADRKAKYLAMLASYDANGHVET